MEIYKFPFIYTEDIKININRYIINIYLYPFIYTAYTDELKL